MGFGRVACVALPFVLTAASLICIMVVGLAGVADKNLYLFRVDTTDLEFNPADIDLENLISSRSVDVGAVAPQPLAARDGNVTSADLGLPNLHDISLWGYCETDRDGDRSCTSARFDWAGDILNETLDTFRQSAALAGQDVSLPDSIEDAFDLFAVVAKWTQVAYVVAMVALGIELLFGVFATCSRAFGCVTFLVAAVTSILVIIAATLSTVMAVVVVGTVEATAKWYGVRSNFNNTFLAFSWLGVAFALGAGFFWMFTVCCCATSHPASRRGYKARSLSELEKDQPTGAYQRLGEQHEMTPSRFGGQGYGHTGPNAGRSASMAYEPYSHSHV